MSKKFIYMLMGSAICLGIGAAAVGCGKEKKDDDTKPVKYEGDMLYNGFDNLADLYRVDQLYTWGFSSANGKLEIVGKDNFMPSEENAEEETEEMTNYQAVIAKIEALPELEEVTFAHKDEVAQARRAYGCLTNENREKVTNLEKLEGLENSDALKGYYTVGDFGGGFADTLNGLAAWYGISGSLVDATSGKVVFKASNISAADGALYVSLFHDDSINIGEASDGITIMVRANADKPCVRFPNGTEINFNAGKSIFSDETYTFEVGYTVAEDYSKITLSIVIRDSEGVEIVNGSQDITEFSLVNFGAQTVQSWLTEHANAGTHKTFYINTGSSKGANIVNAWTPTLPSDYNSDQNDDPHDKNDLSPRQGEGALRVCYEKGKFEEILARFDDSLLAGMPVKQMGGFSVKVYNDSAEEKKVTLSLMKQENVALTVDGGEFTLAPYAWTDCKVVLEPVITEYFESELIGLNISFDDVTDSVYYLDDFRVQFGPVYTDETNEWIEKVAALETQIEGIDGKTITAEDRELLEALCLKYNELPQTFRYTVDNASVLEQAVADYMSAVAAAQIAAEGKETVLHFDSPISATQIVEMSGGSAAYTAEDAAPNESASMKFSFDGSMAWCRIGLSPSQKSGYDEIHVWVKNVSDYKRAVQLDWVVASQVFDAEGNEIEADKNGIIPANSGWIKLVFHKKFPLTQINTTSLSLGNAAISSVDSLLVGKVEFVYNFGKIEETITALPEYYVGYSESDVAAVRAARDAYDALSVNSQMRVTNLSKLIGLEANIWKSGFDAISASSPEGLTVYSEQDMAAIVALRVAYGLLDEEVTKTVRTEEKLLCDFEERIEQLQIAFVEDVKAQIAKLDGSDKAAIAAARAAYDSLTDANKAKVENASILFGFEADIWTATLVDLPALAEIVTYDAALTAKFAEARAAYDGLSDEVKALVAEEEAILSALEARHARFGEVVLKPGKIEATLAKAEDWHVVAIAPSKASGYDEARVVLRNDGATKLVFQATWNAAVKAYDEEGKEIQIVVGYVIPANSGWITLVYTNNFAWSELDLTLFNDANQPIAGDIDLTVESITFIYHAPVVEAMIDALDGTDEAAIKAARAAYEALSTDSKASVTNLDTLIGYEANVWKKGMAGLPTSAEEITAYDAAVYGQVNAMLTSYGQLEPAVQAKLTAEKELLDGLMNKFMSLQDDMVVALKAQIAALDGKDAEAVAAARALYDVLTEENKAKVENASVLFDFEADIWKATLTYLPAEADIDRYYLDVAKRLDVARESYEALADEVKLLVVNEEARLAALEARHAIFGETVLKVGQIKGSGNTWYNIAIAPSKTTGYQAAHVVLRNDGDSDIAFYVNWKVCVEGYNDSEALTPIVGGYLIPAHSGWITLVYTQTDIEWTQLNIANMSGGSAIAGDIDVTVKRITFLYDAPVVETMIDALDGTDEAAIAAARAAYDALSAESQAKVGNVDKLVGYEANVWKKGMTGLPTSAEEVTVYDDAIYGKVNELLVSYGELNSAIQAKLTAEKELLDGLKEKLVSLQAAVVADVKSQIAALDGTDKAAIAAARAAYDALTDENKAKIDNANLLFGYEADIWTATLAALPAEDTIVKYDAALETQLYAVRAEYNALADEVKELVTDGVVTLAALEAKLAQFGEVVARPGDIQMSGQDWYAVAPNLSKTTGYQEAHVKLRNNGTGAIAFQVDWNVAPKAFDAAGNEITADQNGVIAADSGWITLVFTKTDIAWKEFNINDNSKVGSIDVTVESVTFIYQEPVVEPPVEEEPDDGKGEIVATPGDIKMSGQTWYTVAITPTRTSDYMEAHVKLRNNGTSRIIFQVNWNVAVKAYDADGNQIAVDPNGLISANSGWITLVYTPEGTNANSPLVWSQLNIAHYDGGATVGDIDVTVESITFIDAPTSEIVATPGNLTGTGETWYTFAPGLSKTTGYLEAHVKLRNNGTGAIAFQVNWNVATKAFDADGKAIVADKNGVIAANSGWITLVFTQTNIAWTEFNINDNASVGNIDVTVESVTFVYKKEPVNVYDFTNDISQVSAVNNITATYSESEKALALGFDGLATSTWARVDLTNGNASESTEIHVFVKNDTNARIALQVNWKVYAEVADGDATKVGLIWGETTCIQPNSGWVEIVYSIDAATVNQFNIALVDEVTSGALYISKIVVV